MYIYTGPELISGPHLSTLYTIVVLYKSVSLYLGSERAVTHFGDLQQLLTLAPKLTTISTTRALYAFLVPELLPAVEDVNLHGELLTGDDLVRLSRAWPRLRRLGVSGMQHTNSDARGRRGVASFPCLESLTCLTVHTPFPLLTAQAAPLISSVGYTGPPYDILGFLDTGSFASLASLVLISAPIPGAHPHTNTVRTLEFVSQSVLASLPGLVHLGFFVFPADLLGRFFEIWLTKKDLLLHPAMLAEIDFISIALDTPAAQAVLDFLALRRATSAGGMPALNVTFTQKEKKDGCGFPAWLLPQLQRLAGKVIHREEQNLEKLLP